jgi:molybdopterin-guanine dinucleotide biosynthesis protein B
MALFGPPAGGLRALARLLPEVDLVLAEGFRGEPVPRLEVHRRSVSREFLCAIDRRVLAVVTDEPPPRPIRAFTDGDVEAIADLLCDRFGLGARVRGHLKLRVRPGVSTLRADQSERMAALGRSNRMAKTTNRKSGARGGSRRGGRSSSSRTGGRSGGRSAAGRKGGNATLRSRGPEFYSEIGRKGGRSRSRNARRTASSGGRSKGRGSSRRTGSSSARGGARSGRRGGSRSMRRSSR